MADTSLESNGAEVASHENVSLFDEEILFDQDPNEAYFRYMVGIDSTVAEDNGLETTQDVSLQDNWTPMSEVRKTLSPPVKPPQEEDVIVPVAAPVAVPVEEAVDLEQGEEEKKKQERAARIADVPNVIFVGQDPNVHLHVHAKENSKMPDWASLSGTTSLSFISRNRRAFMIVFLLFSFVAIGLAVALVTYSLHQKSSALGSDNHTTVAVGEGSGDADSTPSLPPYVPSAGPPMQQSAITAAPASSLTVSPAFNPTEQPQTTTPISITTTDSPSGSQTIPPIITISPTVSPTPVPTSTRTTDPPTASPTAPPTTLPPTSPPTRPPTSSPPTGTITADLLEVIAFLADASPDGGSALSDETSAQFLAAKWLSEEEWFSLYADWKLLQRYALATMYFSTGGDQWTNTDGWLIASEECKWYETRNEDDVCDSEGRIQMLYIEGNNLIGQLPPEIALLSDTLVRFDVSENALTGTVPSEYGLLTNLQKLSLKRNAIGGSIPTELGRMASMTFLGIGRTELTGTLPTELGLLSELETIGVERNHLEGQIPTEFGQLSLLRQAAFDFNKLTGTVPTQLLELPRLAKLALEYNEFTGVIEFGSGCPIEELKADCDKVKCDCCQQCS